MATSEDTAKERTQDAETPVSPLFGSCPIPIFEHKQIVLGHGSGGKLTADLIDKIFLPAFRNPVLDKLDDQAVLTVGGVRVVLARVHRSGAGGSCSPAPEVRRKTEVSLGKL